MKDKEQNYKTVTTIAVIIAIILFFITILVIVTDGDKLKANETQVGNSLSNKSQNVSNEVKDTQSVENKKDNKNAVLIYEDGDALYKDDLKKVEFYPSEEVAREISARGEYYLYDNFKSKGKSKITYAKSKDFDKAYRFNLKDSDIALYSDYDYEIVPREIKLLKTLPKELTENNPKLKEYKEVEVVSCDLDNDSKLEYVVAANNGDNHPSKIYLAGNDYKIIDKLIEINPDKKEIKDYDHYEIDDVYILDIDNDGIMEIVIEKFGYEGASSLEFYKYKDGKIEGNTKLKVDLVP